MYKYTILFIAMCLTTTLCSAQFTGYYSLHDGGVDVMNSGLFILPGMSLPLPQWMAL
jgi:hypothetical protein